MRAVDEIHCVINGFYLTSDYGYNVTILIIEDDQELNNQLAELLCQKGYEVEQCFDGETGLIKASSDHYQLILLDVMLPKRDGFSLLNILRKSSQTPVIMVTAKGAEQERIQGFSQGADDYVAKPFSTTELLFRIEALLRRSSPEDRVVLLQQMYLCNLLYFLWQNLQNALHLLAKHKEHYPYWYYFLAKS